MPRHAHYVPHGLLPFTDDLAIDENGFREHLSDVAATDGLSAVTVNAHSTGRLVQLRRTAPRPRYHAG